MQLYARRCMHACVHTESYCLSLHVGLLVEVQSVAIRLRPRGAPEKKKKCVSYDETCAKHENTKTID